MKTIAATEFKGKCLRLLDMVQATGEELVISKRGKPVARLIPEKPGKPWLALRGSGRFVGEPGETVVSIEKIGALQP